MHAHDHHPLTNTMCHEGATENRTTHHPPSIPSHAHSRRCVCEIGGVKKKPSMPSPKAYYFAVVLISSTAQSMVSTRCVHIEGLNATGNTCLRIGRHHQLEMHKPRKTKPFLPPYNILKNTIMFEYLNAGEDSHPLDELWEAFSQNANLIRLLYFQNKNKKARLAQLRSIFAGASFCACPHFWSPTAPKQ